ncbi:MAG: sugar ABC transporter permease [Treponema sp.]|nr:sugar ABC transporter permease [Treponema sp.]
MLAAKKDGAFILMILPSVIGFSVLFILPVLLSFAYSVTDWSMYRRTIKFIWFDNYVQLFKDEKIIAAVINSIKYAFVITVVQNILAIAFAVFLHRSCWGANLLKSVMFFPAVLSIMVVGYLFKYIMSSLDYGLLNRIIGLFGGPPVNWLGSARLALYSVLITQVWQWTGWAMVIYAANIKSIDPNLYEAAQIDGVSPWRKFTGVTLPLLYPAVSFNVLMSLIGGLKVFDAIFAMTGGGPGYSSATMMTLLIQTGFNTGRLAFACAFSVVFFTIVFTISRAVMALFNRWEAAVT